MADLPARARAALLLVVTTVALATAGCNYGFRGGSFPSHVRTVAVLPFENETTRFELSQELYDLMFRNLPRSLGTRTGSEESADAVVRGTITGYSVSTPSYRAGADGTPEVVQRQVTVTIQVEIVDRVENVVLWEDRAVRAVGEYLEASETEDVGKQEALENLVQTIVDGAQSNW